MNRALKQGPLIYTQVKVKKNNKKKQIAQLLSNSLFYFLLELDPSQVFEKWASASGEWTSEIHGES